MQFEIGRIYASYLSDLEQASEFFKIVIEKYPNAKIVSPRSAATATKCNL